MTCSNVSCWKIEQKQNCIPRRSRPLALPRASGSTCLAGRGGASVPFVLDLIAISTLAFGLYFPRHHRKDLLVAFVGVNVGVLAVAEAVTSTDVTAGLGFGLFGVLSIIRLRSTELDQQEVAYYFVALALGVLGGVPVTPDWLAPAQLRHCDLTSSYSDAAKRRPRRFKVRTRAYTASEECMLE